MLTKGLKWVSKGGEGREGKKLTKSRGGKKLVYYDKLELQQNCVNHKFYQDSFYSVSEVLHDIYTWSRFIIYIVTSFIVLAGKGERGLSKRFQSKIMGGDHLY